MSTSPAWGPKRSERQTDPSHEASRLQKVRAAERGKEVVESHLVGQVVDGKGGSEARRSLPMSEVVAANAEVDDIARLHAIGIVIVIFLAGERSIPSLRKRDQLRRHRADCAILAGAIRYGISNSRKHSIAGQANGHLLIRREEPDRCARIGNAAHHQTAVKARG